MKKLTILGIFLSTNILLAAAQDIKPAPADKAVVYFVRLNGAGFLINFTYLDSAQVIGKFNAAKYIRYECDPGTHLFWARSENRDFIDAEVEAGKIYFIEVIAAMGAMKAAVRLEPVDPKDTKRMGKLLKLLAKKPAESFTDEELKTETANSQEAIMRGLDKYREEKTKGKAAARLEKSMFYK